MKKTPIIFLIVFVLFVLLSGCSVETGKQADIAQVGWVISKVDTDFWYGNFDDATVFYDFWLYLDGDSISSGDIKKIIVRDENDIIWDVPGSSISVDDNVAHLNRLWTDYYDTWGRVLALGDISFTIKYEGGESASSVLTVPAPGSSSVNGKSFCYDSGYDFQSEYEALPEYADSVIGNKNASQITIQFSCNDDKFYSGWIWFYDNEYQWIGYTDEFRNFETKSVSSLLNSGNLYNDGSLNTFTIDSDQIYYQSGSSYSDIYRFVIVVTDGEQFSSDSDASYDTRSITGYYQF